jgi:hypothetical protein
MISISQTIQSLSNRWVHSCIVALLATCWIGAASIVAQEAPARKRVSLAPPPVSKQRPPAASLVPQCVGVIGGVMNPGAYEIDTTSIELMELVRAAGGLSEDSTGTVRVIRRNQSGAQTSSLDTDRGCLLTPGDLVVAEVRKSKASAADLPGPAGAEGSKMISVGLVNILGRPVVVEISAHRATLARLFALLGQVPESLETVTVLSPGAGSKKIPPEQSANCPLVSGSVVVFVPRTIDSTMLPELPPPIRAPRHPTEVEQELAIEEHATAPSLTAEQKSPTIAPQAKAEHHAPAAAAPAPRGTAKSTPQASTVLAARPPTNEATERVDSDNKVARATQSQIEDSEMESPPSVRNLPKKSQMNIAWIGGIAAVLFVGGWVVVARYTRQRRRETWEPPIDTAFAAAQPALSIPPPAIAKTPMDDDELDEESPPPAAPARMPSLVPPAEPEWNAIEALIENKMAVLEEPTEIPQIELHGRPKRDAHLYLHSPQSKPLPHFPVDRSAAGQADGRVESAASTVTELSPHVSFEKVAAAGKNMQATSGNTVLTPAADTAPQTPISAGIVLGAGDRI